MKRSSVNACAIGASKYFREDDLIRRTSAPVPSEILLDIMRCTDYDTLVALRATHHSSFYVFERNVNALAKRRLMDVHIYKDTVALLDGNEKKMECTFTDVDALKRMSSYVGFHQLTELQCAPDMDIDSMLQAIPALRFVERLELREVSRKDGNHRGSMTDSAEVVKCVSRFPSLRKLDLSRIGRFDWSAFLRSEIALRLQKLIIWDQQSGDEPQENDILRYCFDFSQLAVDADRDVILGVVSYGFLMECFKRLAKLERNVTFGCYLQDYSQLNLITDEFIQVDVESPCTGPPVSRYKSRTTGTIMTVYNDPAKPFISIVHLL